MYVYILDFDANDFAALHTVSEDDIERFSDFDGTSRARRWRPVKVFWETEQGAFPQSDFTTISGAPIFNARAIEVLGDLLEGRGELLPLEPIDGASPCWAFNITRLTDALNEDRTEFAYFRSGRTMDVDRYVFDAERLAEETIFKLSPLPDLYRYVTDRFRRRAEEAGLTGLVWDRCVWSDPDG